MVLEIILIAILPHLMLVIITMIMLAPLSNRFMAH